MQGKDDGYVSPEIFGYFVSSDWQISTGFRFLDTVHLLRLLRKVSTIFRRKETFGGLAHPTRTAGIDIGPQ